MVCEVAHHERVVDYAADGQRLQVGAVPDSGVEEESRGADGARREDDFLSGRGVVCAGLYVWCQYQCIVSCVFGGDAPPSLAANSTEWKEGLPFGVGNPGKLTCTELLNPWMDGVNWPPVL